MKGEPTFSYNKNNSLGFLIGRAYRCLTNELNRAFAEAGFDITQEQWVILVNLWEKEGVSQQELAEKVFREKSIITRTINCLEEKKLVLRVPSEADKRTKLIYLTHQGRILPSSLFPIIQSLIQRAHQNISEQEMAICKKVLQQVYHNMNLD